MKKGAVFVDHTTASAEIARELYAEAKKRGFDFVDAPVSGGQAGAENGVLTVMCGGEPEPYGRAEKVIAAYARMCKLLGPAGAGQLTKMVNQICIAGLVQGLAEGIHFAKKAGLDVEAVIETISKGAAQSWQMENRYKTMAAGKFDFGFAVDWMRKDLVDLPGRSAQERRQPAGDRTGRPVLRGSAEDGRPALGYVEPDRTAGAVNETRITAVGQNSITAPSSATSTPAARTSSRWASMRRIHVRHHDPPCAQIGQPRLENFPAEVARHLAGIAVALDDEEVGAVGDREQGLDPFGVAGIGEQRLAVGEAQRGRRRARVVHDLGGRHRVPQHLGLAAHLDLHHLPRKSPFVRGGARKEHFERASSRARVPGGPAIKSGRSRRARNWASSRRNGSAPK